MKKYVLTELRKTFPKFGQAGFFYIKKWYQPLKTIMFDDIGSKY
jgi:hypothetical protein